MRIDRSTERAAASSDISISAPRNTTGKLHDRTKITEQINRIGKRATAIRRTFRVGDGACRPATCGTCAPRGPHGSFLRLAQLPARSCTVARDACSVMLAALSSHSYKEMLHKVNESLTLGGRFLEMKACRSHCRSQSLIWEPEP